MRNSSLVEGSCAENVTGLKSAAEAVDVQVQTGANAGHKPPSGVRVADGKQRSGQCLGMVGERSSGDEGRLRSRLERGEVRIPE